MVSVPNRNNKVSWLPTLGAGNTAPPFPRKPNNIKKAFGLSVVQTAEKRYNSAMQKGKPPEDLKVSQLISDLSDPESETFNKAVEAGLKTGISLNALQQTLRLLLSLDAPSPESPQRGASLKLPQLAPELYSARKLRDEIGRKETIVEFLRRVWKPWMDADVLSRVELRRLDPSADKAVENWLIHRKLPKDINLPTKKVRNDRALAADPSAVLKSRKLAQVVATRLREGRPVPGYNT